MEFKLTLSEQEAQKILDVLIKEPYGEVFQLIGKVQDQAFEQKQEKMQVSNGSLEQTARNG